MVYTSPIEYLSAATKSVLQEVYPSVANIQILDANGKDIEGFLSSSPVVSSVCVYISFLGFQKEESKEDGMPAFYKETYEVSIMRDGDNNDYRSMARAIWRAFSKGAAFLVQDGATPVRAYSEAFIGTPEIVDGHQLFTFQASITIH